MRIFTQLTMFLIKIKIKVKIKFKRPVRRLHVCAWCRKPLGWRSKLFIRFADPLQLSHGICPDCAATMLEQVHD